MINVRKRSARRLGFTLVELLVVIGIIALLMSILMPALNRMRQQSLSLKCKAQMRSIGQLLLIYAQNNNGWVYPVGEFVDIGEGTPPAKDAHYKTLGHEPGEKDENGVVDDGKSRRWPIYVFEEHVWNPPIMTCPSDQDPVEEHTYILNKHLCDKKDKIVKLHTILTRSFSEVLLMGEKRVDKHDYYMGRKENDPADSEFLIVEPYKHGIKLGSNYLYLDYHVEIQPPNEMAGGKDPWDVTLGSATQSPTTPTTPPNSGSTSASLP